MALTKEPEVAALTLGLRVAVASALCLLVGEWFHIPGSTNSVVFVQFVLARWPFQAVQQGAELFLGLTLAVVCGATLNLLLAYTPPAFFTALALVYLFLTYRYAMHRLPFLFLFAAAYLGHLAYTGMTTPAETFAVSGRLLGQGLLGVGISLLVHGLSGRGYELNLHPAGEPLRPVQPNRISLSARLTITSLLALLTTVWLGLPVTQTMTSALILSAVSDEPGRRRKGLDRAIAVGIAGAYALVALVVLTRLPQPLLLAAFLFAGQFVAAYYARADVPHTYRARQTGMVLAMTLVVPADELGTLSPALQRLGGVVVGLLIAESVGLLWPAQASGRNSP
jgi:uncharacterized membrane protein YccC